MSFLSTSNYRGTRDFYPEQQRLRNWMYRNLKAVLTSFGYEEYAGPILEPFELLASKSSQEIVNEQLYHFEDKGGRRVAIRPEMTPTLARMVAARLPELSRPIRWFSIPTCMRYERPQRGRLREFDQLNVDVFGGNEMEEDVEILLIAVSLLEKFGATHESFTLHVNDRRLLDAFILKTLEVTDEGTKGVCRLIDKRDKISPEEFRAQALALGLSDEKVTLLERYLTSELKDQHELVDAPEIINGLLARLEALKRVTSANIVFSPALARGFDYYTGMVFEVFDNHPENNRAMFGGGRYDNLVSSFRKDKMSGLGFGMGDVPLQNFLESHGLVPELKKEVDVWITFQEEGEYLEACILAQKLRGLGLSVETNLRPQKLGKSLEAASKKGAASVIFFNEEGRARGEFEVKFLSTGVQETGSQATLPMLVEKLRT